MKVTVSGVVPVTGEAVKTTIGDPAPVSSELLNCAVTGGWTLITRVRRSASGPAATVSVMAYAPTAGYWCEEFYHVLVVLTPKFHKYVVMPLSTVEMMVSGMLQPNSVH